MAEDLQAVVGAWGSPPDPPHLSQAGRALLQERLGPTRPRPRPPLAALALPPGRLPGAAAAALASVVGQDGVRADRGARLRHACGSSLTDYVQLRDGVLPAAPDAVVLPSSHEQVLRLLRVCAEHDLAVVPFGGGTSVVGGVAPNAGGHRAVVALAMDRMAELLDVDEVSLTATVQPGITGPVLERLLAARGLHWGHLPQSWQRATVGGYIATRSAGQASTGYGRSHDSVERIVLATATGPVHLGRAPSSAAGPDLREVFIGSEGTLGVITELTLRVRRQPSYRRYEGVVFPSFAAGAAAFRALAQADLSAAVMRLSDEAETEVTMAMSGPQGPALGLLRRYLGLRGVTGTGSLAILGWEGVSPAAASARRRAARVGLRRFGAVGLGSAVGESWRRHRFEGPYLRDLLLDEGYIVETLETAADWARLPQLHRAVAEAVRGALAVEGREPLVLCHVSHVYGTGASLYFTVVAVAAEDRAGQWAAAKQAAGGAIMANGGTITHHHAVGSDHRPWLPAEIGETGVQVLRAVKASVDPDGILNPGKLLP